MLNSGNADVLFYHPALLARATGFGGAATLGQRFLALQCPSARIPGGTWASDCEPQYGAGSDDELHAPLGQDQHFKSGGERGYERTASIGYGREVWGALSQSAVELLETWLSSFAQHHAHRLLNFVDLGPIESVG